MDMTAFRDLLTANMSEPLAGNVDNPEYWYPLAVATYGVEEVLQAIDSMVTYRTSMWRKTQEFEELFGRTYGGEAVMVNSGSSADLLMVFANLTESGGVLRKGDEVLVPAVTWPTHLWSVVMAGLKPVLVDVDPATLNVSVDDLRSKVSDKTAAIFPVHLMGNPAPMDDIWSIADDAGALVLEDSCEALGAKWRGNSVGSLGQAGSFSFFFSHHMTTMEGGMILTKDEELAERLRLLRAHGWSRNVRQPERLGLSESQLSGLDPRYTFVEWGFNVRPTELQAGFGLEQLKRIPKFEEHRRVNFSIFRELLEERDLAKYIQLPKALPESEPSWFALAMMVQPGSPKSRDDLVYFLGQSGVETRPIVAGSLAKHPVRTRFPDIFETALPGADAVHSHGFYIGLYPFEMRASLVRVADLMARFYGTH